MNQRTLIAIGVALLVAATGAVFFINRDTGDDPGKSVDSADRTGNKAGGLAPAADAPRPARSKARQAGDHSHLVEKYGEARTNLSRHVAGNVVSLIEDGVAMGEMASGGPLGAAMGGGRGMLGMSLGGLQRDLNLSDEQREKAAAILEDYQKRELARSKETIEQLKKDPTSLMELMLAGDAHSRGQLSEDEFNQVKSSAGSNLQGVFNPMDQNSLRGQPLQDEQFRSQFEAILEPSQIETFQGATAAGAAPSGIVGMGAMDLEQLDQTVSSVKQITGGMKQMLQGMGNLQDFGPMFNQQRGNRGNGD